MAIPVYLFAGFLEAGKTAFIASVLQDPGFTQNEKTLIIQCEEGLDEFEPAMLRNTHSVIEMIEDEDEFEEETLKSFLRRHHPDRVIIEMNGMWNLDAAIQRMPLVMELFQIITIVNSETFELYSANMGTQMLMHITDADMVVFNRATEETRQLIRDRNVRAMNPQASIYFENADGTSEDYGAGMPPPYDMDAPVVEIEDDWFGILYIDANENPDAYDQKTVRLKVQIRSREGLADGEFVIGRKVMVCCANDIRYVGFLASANGHPVPKTNSWQMLTAKIRVEERDEYRGPGPVFYVESMEPASPPAEEVVNLTR